MAKKDNTLMVVGLLAVGGYLLWEHSKKVAANATSPSVADPGSTLQVTSAKPVVLLPPSTQVNTKLPVNASSASSAPSTVAINTTHLVPAPVVASKIVMPQGYSLALDANGNPIVNAAGIPLTFPPAEKPSAIMGIDESGCEVL